MSNTQTDKKINFAKIQPKDAILWLQKLQAEELDKALVAEIARQLDQELNNTKPTTRNLAVIELMKQEITPPTNLVDPLQHCAFRHLNKTQRYQVLLLQQAIKHLIIETKRHSNNEIQRAFAWKELFALIHNNTLSPKSQNFILQALNEYCHNNSKDHYALFMLGFMYQCGSGVNKDLEEAQRLYTKAAKHGNKRALCALAQLANMLVIFKRPCATISNQQNMAMTGQKQALALCISLVERVYSPTIN